jgi:hypothetical protein
LPSAYPVVSADPTATSFAFEKRDDLFGRCRAQVEWVLYQGTA